MPFSLGPVDAPSLEDAAASAPSAPRNQGGGTQEPDDEPAEDPNGLLTSTGPVPAMRRGASAPGCPDLAIPA